MSNKLKYQSSIDLLKLINCPPKNATAKECEAFRFCFDTLDHEETWITQATKHERTSTLPRRNVPPKTTCDSFGLSFFTSAKNAETTWRAFNARIKERLGYKHLCGGLIHKNDGLCSAIEKSGHFNLSEYENCDLGLEFKIIAVLG